MSLRLDKALLLRGLVATRSRARDLIVRGAVRVDGAVALKPGVQVAEDAPIALAESPDYVSRGALKLAAALEAFGVDPAGPRVRSMSGPRRAASRRCCCGAGRGTSLRSMSDMGSCTRASCGTHA